jgi:hypothetical protein
LLKLNVPVLLVEVAVPELDRLVLVPELEAVVVAETPGPFGCDPKQYILRPEETWICLPILEQRGFWRGFGTNSCAFAVVVTRARIDAIKMNRSNLGKLVPALVVGK